jgi:hypothetical protein
MLNRVLAPEVASASRSAMLSGVAAGTAALLTDFATTLEDLELDDEKARARHVEPGCIAIISATYSVLHAAALAAGPVAAIEDTCRRTIELARHLRSLHDVGPTRSMTSVKGCSPCLGT